MGTLRVLRRWIARFGAQRWRREALLAVALTLAAAAFIATALTGGDISSENKAPLANAHQPQQ